MTTYQEFDWYEAPLYYDIVFEEDTEQEGTFLETMLKLHGKTRGRRTLEPACGSGRLVEEMARRGYPVTGFDISKPSLQFARERLQAAGHRAQLRQARMEDFRFAASFDLAHCFVSTFKYLLTEDAATQHLQSIQRALKPGGLYVLGFHLSDYDDLSRSRERWVGQRRNVEVVCNIQSWPPDRRTRLERVRSRLRVKKRGQAEELRYETSWWFRTYDARQFKRLLKRVPGLQHIATYDFCYDLRRRREFNDEQLDNVVILRKR
jgi:SAM-dependent methyltransferase